jgi:hypothetical protein
VRGRLRYPGPETGVWEIGFQNIPDVMYQLPDREVLMILAPVDGGEPVQLCGICGSVLNGPGESCSRCALFNESVAAALDNRRLAESVEEWLKGQSGAPAPHPLEAEPDKIQKALDALKESPPPWWADRLLWRGLRGFYRMRSQRIKEVLDASE